MRQILLATALVLATGAAAAQSIDNNAHSGSESTSQSYGAVSNNIITNGPDRVHTTAATSIGGFAGSFSPDNCTNTAGAAGYATGWGLSIGAPKGDENCRRMRVIERGGQLASQAQNLGFDEIAGKVYMLNVWNWCTSSPELTRACQKQGLVGESEPR